TQLASRTPPHFRRSPYWRLSTRCCCSGQSALVALAGSSAGPPRSRADDRDLDRAVADRGTLALRFGRHVEHLSDFLNAVSTEAWGGKLIRDLPAWVDFY